MLIDSHCHIYDEKFAADRDEVIKNAAANGIERIFMPNCDSSTIEAMIKCEDNYPGICLSMMGLHPCYVKENYKEELKIVEHWLGQRPFLAIGEIGLDFYWDKTFVKEQEAALKELRSQWLGTMMPVMEVMVMEEMRTKRKAYLYNRGDYEQPAYEVNADTPEILPPYPESLPKNRLGLSQWLFSRDNPLTARVTVNRYWQMLFGKGLVDTPSDFGVQGSLPTHPELLDWLANSFQSNDWNVKDLLKTMVMSHTYKQSSKVSKKLLQNDPNNKLLARTNSYRLPAEMIRDNALAASGLLVQQLGGKSVKPYQPPDLWIEKTSFSHELLRYKESQGDSLYRRSLYTFIRRTQPHPAMVAFDSPSREVCTINRENTNTPLQALVLLNDKQFVEASKILAQRVQNEGGDSIEGQISYAFRLVTSRKPKLEELSILKELFNNQQARFQKNPKEAMDYLTVGEKMIDKSLDKNKTAALAVVANTLLNHDEAYTKR